MSDADLKVLEDFRAVEAECLGTFAVLWHEREIRLGIDDLEHRIRDQLITPWRDLELRVSAAAPLADAKLDERLRHYLAVRKSAWEALAASASDEARHIARYRDDNELADADAKSIADSLDDHPQISFVLFGTVDTAGVATILDRRRDAVMQPGKRLGLPLPVLGRYNSGRAPGPFDVDAAGRIWVELADGLNVIDRSGKRVVFPLGSLELLTRPIEQIVVLGAGPVLPTPVPARMHAITGALTPPVANVPLVMCADAYGDPPCAPGLPHWDAITDVNGRFSFSNVPRFELGLEAFLGDRGAKFWRTARSTCCAQEASEIGDVSIDSGVVY